MPRDIEKLLSRLSGFNRPSENAAISELIADADDSLSERLEKELAKSQWPLCTSLAAALGQIGSTRAKEALISNLSARKHHVRTAVIKALAVTGDPTVVERLRPFLADGAFETRIAAKEAIQTLTGEKVVTAKGE